MGEYMSPTEYLVLVFFWVCFVSVDSAQRGLGNFDLSKPTPTVFSRTLGVLNVAFLQWLFPLFGFTLVFGDPLPVDVRKFVFPCVCVIATACVPVNFGYWAGFKNKPLKAELFLLSMLIIGIFGWGFGLKFLDRKYNLFGGSVGIPLSIAVFNLYYGARPLLKIMKRIGKLLEERQSANYQI
jgi:hypothetical protein